jgi:hypothetical protein
LRHTFGTQAIRVLKIHEVQQLMGHRHIATTERYLHYAPDRDIANRLTALWDGPVQPEARNPEASNADRREGSHIPVGSKEGASESRLGAQRT